MIFNLIILSSCPSRGFILYTLHSIHFITSSLCAGSMCLQDCDMSPHEHFKIGLSREPGGVISNFVMLKTKCVPKNAWYWPLSLATDKHGSWSWFVIKAVSWCDLYVRNKMKMRNRHAQRHLKSPWSTEMWLILIYNYDAPYGSCEGFSSLLHWISEVKTLRKYVMHHKV